MKQTSDITVTQTFVYLVHFVAVQLLSCVGLCATPWTTAHQAFLSFTISLSLLKPIELVMPSNHLIFCRPLFLSSAFPRISIFFHNSPLIPKCFGEITYCLKFLKKSLLFFSTNIYVFKLIFKILKCF